MTPRRISCPNPPRRGGGALSSQRRAASPLRQVQQWLVTAGMRLLRWEVLQVRPRARRAYVMVAAGDGAGLLLRFTGKRLCFAAVDPWSEVCTSGTLFPLVREACPLEEVERLSREFGVTVQKLRRSGDVRRPVPPLVWPWWASQRPMEPGAVAAY